MTSKPSRPAEVFERMFERMLLSGNAKLLANLAADPRPVCATWKSRMERLDVRLQVALADTACSLDEKVVLAHEIWLGMNTCMGILRASSDSTVRHRSSNLAQFVEALGRCVEAVLPNCEASLAGDSECHQLAPGM